MQLVPYASPLGGEGQGERYWDCFGISDQLIWPSRTFTNNDFTELKRLEVALDGREQVGCVEGFEYSLPEVPSEGLSDHIALTIHDRECLNAALEVGWDSKMDFGREDLTGPCFPH